MCGVMMKEIRIHGRGGQGSVTAAELLAVAAFEDGQYSQAFPSFGVERRGAPVVAFTRIDDEPIRMRSQVYNPDYVIVQDVTLMDVVDVAGGLKEDGMMIINTEASAEKFEEVPARVMVVDATRIAMEIIGRPIVNTVLLGAFAGATHEIRLNSIRKAVGDRFSGTIGEKNIKAVEAAYNAMEES